VLLKIQLLQLILNIMQESKNNMGKIGKNYGHKTTPTHPIAKTHIWIPIGSLVLKNIVL
jgi:hypothetical protein